MIYDILRSLTCKSLWLTDISFLDQLKQNNIKKIKNKLNHKQINERFEKDSESESRRSD